MWGMGKKDMPDNPKEEKSSPWGNQFDSAIDDARKAGVGSKARAKADGSASEKAGSGGGISQETAKKLAKIFEPEKWKAIVRAPFSLGKAKTGRDLWDLTKAEEESLAECTSAAAEHFMTVDPKYLVLTLLVFNWSVIVSSKVSQNTAARKKEELENPPPVSDPITHPVLVK